MGGGDHRALADPARATDQRRSLPARTRRGPGTGRDGGDHVPRWGVVDARWVPRRRGVLRHLGVSDHAAAARRTRADGPDQHRRFLRPPGPPAAPGDHGAVRRRGHVARRAAIPARVAGPAARPAVLGDLLRVELVPDPHRRVVLRRHGTSPAAPPPVVAGSGGAVLHRLAAVDGGRDGCLPPPPPADRHGLPGARPRLVAADGLDVRLVEPQPGLSRHRHPSLGAAARGGDGDDLAALRAGPRAAAQPGEDRRHRRGGRLARPALRRHPLPRRGVHRRPGQGLRRALPRRFPVRRAGDDAGHRLGHPHGLHLRAEGPRDEAVGLAGHPLVRAVPVALAGVPADAPRRRRGRRRRRLAVVGADDRAPGDHLRPDGAVVPADRDPDPPTPGQALAAHVLQRSRPPDRLPPPAVGCRAGRRLGVLDVRRVERGDRQGPADRHRSEPGRRGQGGAGARRAARRDHGGDAGDHAQAPRHDAGRDRPRDPPDPGRARPRRCRGSRSSPSATR